jgi:beta-lactamase class A
MRKFFLALAVMALLAAALLTPSYLWYCRTKGVIPAWVRLAGLDINGATTQEVSAALAQGLDEPLAVYFDDQRLLLRPQTIGFQADIEGMLADAKRYDTPDNLLRYLVWRGIGRAMPPMNIPLRYTVDQVTLDNWLADVALSHNRAPRRPQPVLSTLSISPGQPGLELDLETSRERVIAALARPEDRTVRLALRESPAPAIDMKVLEELLTARLEQFPGIASVFLQHVPSGDEIAINAEVAYAGMSTMKILILGELYRKLDQPPGIETTKLITETMSQSGNFTANLLLRIIGDGDSDAGVRTLNQSLRKLGLKNSFMATPYDRKYATPPRVVTEANSKSSLDTHPDPYIQTTPRDIALGLEMLVSCSRGGGTLLAAYGNQYTPAECQQALDFIALNEVHALTAEGVPEDTQMIHKHGYAADTHGDVAAIWGPDGPYVLSVFLYRPPWLEWDLSRATMRDVSQAVWNYFSGAYQTSSADAGSEGAPAGGVELDASAG